MGYRLAAIRGERIDFTRNSGSAGRRGWQTEPATDRPHGSLDRLVGGVHPPLVGVKLAQGRGRSCGSRQARPGLVDAVKRSGDHLRLGRERDSQQAAVERVLDADGATEICLGSSEIVLIAIFQRIERRIEPAVSRPGNRQVSGRQFPPRNAGRQLPGGRRGGCLRRCRMIVGGAPPTEQAGTANDYHAAPSGPARRAHASLFPVSTA